MNLQGNMITLTSSDDAKIGCYHVEAKAPRKGGLVLIQEIFGVTDDIKRLSDSFAEDGYEVVTPSMFDRIEKGFQGGHDEQDMQKAVEMAGQNPMDHAVMDVQMGIDFLKERGPVYLTGFCYGGSVTWAAACRCDGLAAASSYYGRLITEHLDEIPKCPIDLHFGEHDPIIPMENVAMIKASHRDLPIYVYDAGHGFVSERPDHYDEAAAKLSRQRTLKLFAENT